MGKEGRGVKGREGILVRGMSDEKEQRVGKGRQRQVGGKGGCKFVRTCR